MPFLIHLSCQRFEAALCTTFCSSVFSFVFLRFFFVVLGAAFTLLEAAFAFDLALVLLDARAGPFFSALPGAISSPFA